MNTFEQNLEKLEKLTNDIKRSDISLEDALKDFEEGIKLAAGMEKELDKIEGKIQILMNELFLWKRIILRRWNYLTALMN